MSESADLKKLMESNTRAINALIQSELNSDRLKNETASNQRILDGLHEKIKTAQAELDSLKQDASKTASEAKKNAEDVLRDAELAKTQAMQSKLESARLMRLAQDRADEAQSLKTSYESALADVVAQKEKLKAALV